MLWPVMRRALPDGTNSPLEVEHENQEVDELVTRLENLDLADPAPETLLDRIPQSCARCPRRGGRVPAAPPGRHRPGHGARAGRVLGARAAHRTNPGLPGVARRPPGKVLAALPLSEVNRRRDPFDVPSAMVRREPRRHREGADAASRAAPAGSSVSRSADRHRPVHPDNRITLHRHCRRPCPITLRTRHIDWRVTASRVAIRRRPLPPRGTYAITLAPFERLHFQQRVCRFSGTLRPPLETGMM